jgi:hypothetical protein
LPHDDCEGAAGPLIIVDNILQKAGLFLSDLHGVYQVFPDFPRCSAIDDDLVVAVVEGERYY